jgi:cytochrome c oxidase subunit 1
VSTFSKKPIFGYLGMAYAMVPSAWSASSCGRTTCTRSAWTLDTQAYFVFATMVIAVPTGVKIFSWIATMWGGSIEFRTPMLWAIGFIFLFTVGGVTGVQLANAGLDRRCTTPTTWWRTSTTCCRWAPCSRSSPAGTTGSRRCSATCTIRVLVAQAALLGHLHRREPPVLPAALPGSGRHAAPYIDYPDAFAGWNYISSYGSYISAFGVLIFLYGVWEAFAKKRVAGDNPVGRGRNDAGMDAVLAAAVPPVRDPAAHQVSAAQAGTRAPAKFGGRCNRCPKGRPRRGKPGKAKMARQ